jgi:cytochrome bd ubiquinol oxidase subunit II
MTQYLPHLFAGFAALAIVFYVVLDGFDLGVGLLFPFAPAEAIRWMMMTSIAPVWDGNETFLVLGAMVLVTGFPAAVSVILPALFTPLMLMLFGLIIRGVAFEFRAYGDAGAVRLIDAVFACGSLLMTLGQGFALGGFIQGLPVGHNASGAIVFAGGPLSWLSPFSLLVGVCLTFGYGLLGSTWLIWRTDGPTQSFARVVAPYLLIAACVSLLLVSGATLFVVPTAMGRWLNWPGTLALLPIPVVALATFFFVGHTIGRAPEYRPFVGTLVLFGSAFAGLISLLWPFAVPYVMTLNRAASRSSTMAVMAAALTLVLPVVFGYLALQYWVFRGKTRAEPDPSADLSVTDARVEARVKAISDKPES